MEMTYLKLGGLLKVKILITAAIGLLGGHLLQLLRQHGEQFRVVIEGVQRL